MSRRRSMLLGLLVASLLTAACSSPLPTAPPASLGILQNRAVPSIPLVNQRGAATTLAAFRGKTVVLVPMLTLCQEVCPLTTEDLLLVQHAVDRAGLASDVAIVEYSVDPTRDTPARLAAYARLTGAPWTFLTGSPANIDAMNKFFYVFAQKVAEGSPPQLDWWTHRPLTYDVNHTDGFFLIAPDGHERFATSAAPDVSGHGLPPALHSMLDTQGLQNLNDPSIQGQTWSPAQLAEAVGWMVHHDIPLPH